MGCARGPSLSLLQACQGAHTPGLCAAGVLQGSSQATEESVRWLLEVYGSMLFLELHYR